MFGGVGVVLVLLQANNRRDCSVLCATELLVLCGWRVWIRLLVLLVLRDACRACTYYLHPSRVDRTAVPSISSNGGSSLSVEPHRELWIVATVVTYIPMKGLCNDNLYIHGVGARSLF